MCGIFGFVAKKNGEMDMDAIERAARSAMTRGSHAFGIAWVDRRGQMRMAKRPGRVIDHLDVLHKAKGARMMIGHCRYATSGSVLENDNNHPHPVKGGWFVHNGMIPGHEKLIRKFKLDNFTNCDSELFGLIADEIGIGPNAMRDAVNLIPESPTVVLSLWGRPGRVAAFRRTPATYRAGKTPYHDNQGRETSKPFHFGMTDDGFYLGSYADGLPGEVYRTDPNSQLIFEGGQMNYSLL